MSLLMKDFRELFRTFLGLFITWAEIKGELLDRIRAASRENKRQRSNDVVFVRGDEEVPPTRAGRKWFDMRFFWRQQAVLQVMEEQSRRGFFVGFFDHKGRAFLRVRPIHDQKFRMRVGHEDVTFFALGNIRCLIQLRLLGVFPRDGKNFITARDLRRLTLY